MVFVKGKNIKTPKGKSKGKKGGEGKTNAMQVDKAGKGKGKCFGCKEKNHLGRDCPARQQRIAEGEPAIRPNNLKAKGVGKGMKSKRGANFYPTSAQWNGMYPGLSPQMWQSWRPQTLPMIGGKGVNLFEVPNQFVALQQMFQSQQPYQQTSQGFPGFQIVGSVYSLVPKDKSRKVESVWSLVHSKNTVWSAKIIAKFEPKISLRNQFQVLESDKHFL